MAPTPEQLAREQIDDLLTASGWVLQNYKELNLGAGRGIALREVPLKTGPSDNFNRPRMKVTEQGGKVVPSGGAATRPDAAWQQTGPIGFYVDRRSKETRAVRWSCTAGDEDLTYPGRGPTGPRPASPTFAPRKRESWFRCPTDLDRSVVVKSQIRTVLTAFKEALATELFPGRTLVPKVLIFCKDDSHAEDTVHLVREVFGRGNDFAKKITYKAYNAETKRYEKSETLIQEFRTSPTLRIAVTVDMIATGTDIKPLECLLFLRDTRSRTYFEQMKGRGTRVLTPTDLQSVSGADARSKTHFVIVDAVGVCESDKTDSRPLERQRTVPFPQLLLGVALGKRDEDTLTTLAGRLSRLDREIDHKDTKALRDLAGGKSLGELARDLLNACDPDVIANVAQASLPASASDSAAWRPEPTPEQIATARQQLATAACAPFDLPALRDALAKAKQDAEQTIDVTTEDTVLSQGFDAAAKAKAAGLVQAFRNFIAKHQAEITALQILYSRPYAHRLTEPMLKELEQKLRDNHAAWTEDRLWDAFAVTAPDKVKGRSQAGRFADLVSLVRFALEKQPVLEPFSDSVAERFDQWLQQRNAAALSSSPLERVSNGEPVEPGGAQRRGVSPGSIAFTTDQLAWLHLMRDHIATSLNLESDDFDFSPFAQRGGLGRAHQLFGAQLPQLLDELNRQLVA